MAKAYTKEFLIDVYMHKYIKCGFIPIEDLCNLEELAIKFYDKVGRDEFRKYADVTPERIKDYNLQASV